MPWSWRGRWFGEGFTEYYGIIAAQRAGLIEEADAKAAFADLQAEMRFIEKQKGPRSLSAASKASHENAYASRIMYSKGALLAWLVNERLSQEGRNLDEPMRVILDGTRRRLTTADLKRLFHDACSGRVDDLIERYTETNAVIPRIDFGPATGKSGVARFLPEE